MSRAADKLQLNTTFDPVTYAAVTLMAQREDPGRGAANVPLRRLIREGTDPATWDRLVRIESDLPKDMPPRERVNALLAAESDLAAELLRARRPEGSSR